MSCWKHCDSPLSQCRSKVKKVHTHKSNHRYNKETLTHKSCITILISSDEDSSLQSLSLPVCMFPFWNVGSLIVYSKTLFFPFPGVQSCPHVWCQSGSAGQPAVCPVGWGWGLESDMSNSTLRMAHCASSTQRKRRSVWSTMNAVSLSLYITVCWLEFCFCLFPNWMIILSMMETGQCV